MNQGECGWLSVNNETKCVHRGSGKRTEWRIPPSGDCKRQYFTDCRHPKQILRDNNKVVDCIAKEARGEIEQLIIHVDPLKYVRSLLEDDIHRVMHTLIVEDQY
ncbi:hypothetical protein Goari_009517 [Gossypium aridum]|uniref:Uncharacterized protein n=1 Tax=Gossypium aridum TaxID=34290 RepID=A0A7J8XX87_GOSAI|nr:hypothetical protein [Gossypium aridum]